jgi:hypothetical protein
MSEKLARKMKRKKTEKTTKWVIRIIEDKCGVQQGFCDGSILFVAYS